MPYISNENILFIHIPKTGGTSVEFFFDMTKISNFFSDKWDQEKTAFIQKYPVLTELGRVNFEPQHFTPEILSRLIPNYSTYFSFTFVRNPYTRILSEYFWEEEIVRNSKVHDFDKYTFHRWCENYLKELNSSHKIPQVEYIDTHIDFIGKYYAYPLLDSKSKIQWPGKYPDKAAIEREKRKVNNTVTWHREYLLEIISSIDQVVQHEWIQTYSSIPQSILDGYHETICGVDFAASEKVKADHSALVTLIVAWQANTLKIYVLPNPFYARVSFPVFQEKIAATYAGVADGCPVRFVVESNGMQKGLVQILETAGLPVEAVHVSTDKRARLAMTSSLFQSGQVEFHYLGNKQLITQLTNFGIEKHDDLVDALTIALNYVISNFKPIGTYGEYADEPAELWYDSPTAGIDEIIF